MELKYRNDMPEDLLERLGRVYNHYRDYAKETIPTNEVIVEETIVPEEKPTEETDEKIKRLEELNEKILNIMNSPEWKKYVKGE